MIQKSTHCNKTLDTYRSIVTTTLDVILCSFKVNIVTTIKLSLLEMAEPTAKLDFFVSLILPVLEPYLIAKYK